jgi:hypothetical protein
VVPSPPVQAESESTTELTARRIANLLMPMARHSLATGCLTFREDPLKQSRSLRPVARVIMSTQARHQA